MDGVRVTWHDVEFEVSGKWIPCVGSRIASDPFASEDAEGGYFEDAIVTLGGVDVGELFAETILEVDAKKAYRLTVLDAILDAAAEAVARGELEAAA